MRSPPRRSPTAGIEGRRARRRSGSPTSARPSSPGTRQRRARCTGRWSGRTAAPPSAARSCARPVTSGWSASAPASSSTPTSPATKIEWLLRNVEGAGRAVVRDGRLLARLQAHRPPRHRPHQRLADDALRHPPAALGRGALRAARDRSGEPARAAALGQRLRDDRRVRRRGPGRRHRRRPAGGALRPGLLRPGQRQEHLRHRQLRPAQHRTAGAAARRRPADDARLRPGERARLRARGLDLRHRRRGAVAARRPRDHRGGGGDRGRWPPPCRATTTSTSSPL